MITLTVTGLDETINRLNQQINDLPVARRAILAEGSRFLVNELKRNAHVISGAMRDSVRADLITDISADVIVGVPYAVYENARAGTKPGYGPHNFADRAFQATQFEFQSRIVAGYDRLFSSF
jgi:hypothetical protein